MKRWQKNIAFSVVSIFALIGFAFTVVFIGMQFGAFNVRGSIEARNAFFGNSNQSSTIPMNIIAVKPCTDEGKQNCTWQETPEWAVVKGGLEKDAGLINRVAGITGVDSRMIAAVVIPEQIRFFVSSREVFKRYFEPLKILGSLTKFSLGVSGIKEETANRIEQYANDPKSVYYPGPQYAALIAYDAGQDHDATLYARLTDDKNHYYSYLYTAIYIKEITAQWQRAGYDVAKNPDVIATLFNIGFDASRPNASPQAAGAVINVGGKDYPFGVLGASFYRSSELTDIFPN